MAKYCLLAIMICIACCSKNSERMSTSVHSVPGQLSKTSILNYADSIDHQVKNAIKQESLVYTLGDYSFYVTRFIRNSKVLQYTETGRSATLGNTEKTYYLKEGKVVLLVHQLKSPGKSEPLLNTRTFYAGDEQLFSEQKTAKTDSALKESAYLQTGVNNTDIDRELRKLNDAIYQRGSFDLLLEGITEYPRAKFLVLSRNSFNSYRAALLLEKEDDLVRSIISSPEKYRGRKLDLSWDLRDRARAVYVSGRLAN